MRLVLRRKSSPRRDSHYLRSRRGVSPIIAELILVAVTVSIGFAFWTSANSTAGTKVSGFVEKSSSNINKIKEDFVMVNTAFNYDHSSNPPNPTSGMITIWVYNIGLLETEISQIQVERKSTQEVAVFDSSKFVLGSTNCISPTISIEELDCIVVDLNDPSSGPTITIVSGEIYVVLGTALRGTTATLQEVSP